MRFRRQRDECEDALTPHGSYQFAVWACNALTLHANAIGAYAEGWTQHEERLKDMEAAVAKLLRERVED